MQTHPSETVDTVRGSFEVCDIMGFDAVDVTERTELAKIAVKEGVISNSPDELLFPTFYPVSETVLAEVVEQTARRAGVAREPGVDRSINSTWRGSPCKSARNPKFFALPTPCVLRSGI